MDLKNFRFGGIQSSNHASPSTTHTLARSLRATEDASLGALALLVGCWKGTGFNQIWRPVHGAGAQDRFLELNQTTETLQFEEIPGEIPNRGLLQADINMRGLHYLQQINDAVALSPDGQPVGLHLEPGVWLSVPLTTNPNEPATVARLATIPHGSSITLQGTSQVSVGGPEIGAADITPFVIDKPGQKIPFPESNLATPSAFRTAASDIPAVTQAMVDDPNTALRNALTGQKISSTVTMQLSTSIAQVAPPSCGGGTADTAFLAGTPAAGPNARAAQVDAVFWIETVEGPAGTQLQLQYTQRVLLNFNGLSWPHISVATLIKQP
ncbi:heme-binding protein [Mitsuaria sp. GD03876]|uniref:heme-binding protein n=1 Tax=Mitsuaria sp. GD03876 TaxID=2975399 RepID=UPI00244BFD13|nr:heme-binding protein [Mitsuaria sp. GD03876]MDH0868141.1 heme-binding protein [Mitsuaria sp. GD03876]